MKKQNQNLAMQDFQAFEVEAVFRIANLIPAGTQFPSFFDFIGKKELASREDYQAVFEEWFDLLKQSPELYRYVVPEPPPDDPLEFRSDVIGKFEEFERIRAFAEIIAEYADKYRASLADNDPHYFWDRLKGRGPRLDLPATLWVGDKGGVADGIVRFKTEWFADVFAGADITKILRCLVCKNLFWQNRKDKQTCSKKCSTVLAVAKNRGQQKRNEKGK